MIDISKIDILNQKFSTSFFGYNKTEVDLFLQELANSMGQLAEENEDLQKQVETLSKTLEEYKGREVLLQNTLMTTQKMVDDIKANANQEAKNIVEEARIQAEKILRQAHERVERIQEDIRELERQRQHFEVKLKALIESHLKLLESNAVNSESSEGEGVEGLKAKGEGVRIKG